MDILHLDQQTTLALNGSDSLFWDNVMSTVTSTWSWSLLMLTLLYVIFHNNNLRDGIVILLVAGLMIFVADRLCSGVVKPMVARWRPTRDPQIMYLLDVVNGYRGGSFGFFSGHACNTFSMATFLALLFRHRGMTLTLFFWCITTTFTRLYLGVHYLGDVTVGAIVGTLIGCLFAWLLRKILERISTGSRMSYSGYTSTGYLLSDMNVFLTMIFLNYILVIIVSMMIN